MRFGNIEASASYCFYIREKGFEGEKQFIIVFKMMYFRFCFFGRSMWGETPDLHSLVLKKLYYYCS